ncbi:hypothetical protein D9M69_709630 [compost metagenome]
MEQPVFVHEKLRLLPYIEGKHRAQADKPAGEGQPEGYPSAAEPGPFNQVSHHGFQQGDGRTPGCDGHQEEKHHAHHLAERHAAEGKRQADEHQPWPLARIQAGGEHNRKQCHPR